MDQLFYTTYAKRFCTKNDAVSIRKHNKVHIIVKEKNQNQKNSDTSQKT